MQSYYSQSFFFGISINAKPKQILVTKEGDRYEWLEYDYQTGNAYIKNRYGITGLISGNEIDWKATHEANKNNKEN